jgi:hypothetical protein
MADSIADLLLEAGLIQFGYFTQGNQTLPLRLSLNLLPAYPQVLNRVAEQLVKEAAKYHIERFLCDAESLPTGVAVSLLSGIPLVYSQGGAREAVYDLIGAYDVGHPTALILNVLENQQKITRLSNAARRVGLEVRAVCVVVTIHPLDSVGSALVDIGTLTRELVSQQRLSQQHGDAVVNWLATPHPD